jgi:hypothetical protein
MACYHPNPEKRPTSYQLADALGTVYDSVKDNKKLSPTKFRDLFIKK